jgi:hypothetical protein
VHAVLVTVNLKPGNEEEQLQYLNSNTVPLVKQSAGIVSGYWLEPVDGKGVTVLLFESEDAAQMTAKMVPNTPWPDFASFGGVEVREVVAQL